MVSVREIQSNIIEEETKDDSEKNTPEVKPNNFLDDINLNSLNKLFGCQLEPCLRDSAVSATVQFERLGYYCLDKMATSDHLIFNQTIGLRENLKEKI